MGEIIGRFHPLIVHLPIGMLILAFIIELASRKQHHLRYVMPFVLRVTIFFSVLAWFTGWIMPKEGEFDERLVSLHFWFALAVTLVTMLLYYLNQRCHNAGKKKGGLIMSTLEGLENCIAECSYQWKMKNTCHQKVKKVPMKTN